MPEFVWELPSVRPEPEESGAVAEGAIDHVTDALRRLVVQFQKPKFKAMVRVFVTPLVELEQTIIDCLTLRTLDTAIGEQLNVLGRIVGQDQVDVTDTTYRSLIRARIPANKSEGLGNDVVLVVRLVLSDYAGQEDVVAAGVMSLQITDRGDAEFALVVNAVDVPQDLAVLVVEQFLRDIVGTGIRAVLEYTVQEEDSLLGYLEDFAFDDSWQATSTFEGGATFQVLAAQAIGAASNGFTIQILDSGGFGNFIDETTPDTTRIYVEPGVTTWAQVYADVATSTRIEVLEEIAAGATLLTAGDFATVLASGGLDETDGTGFADVDAYPRNQSAANSVFFTGDWAHIHLCDNGAALDGVTQDATALAQCPADVDEWTEFLAEDGIPVPNWAIWNFQELSSPVVDATGNGHDLVETGTLTYGYGFASWDRTFVAINDVASSKLTTAITDANTESFLVVMLVSLQATPAALRTLFEHPNVYAEVTATPRYQVNAGSAVAGTFNPVPAGDPGPVYILGIKHDIANSKDTLYINGVEVVDAVFFNVGSVGVVSFGRSASGNQSPFAAFGYAAAWRGASAELSDDQVNRIINKMKGRGDVALIGGLDLDEDGAAPTYGEDGMPHFAGDYAFGVGLTGRYFSTSDQALMATAADDFAFACALPELGSGGTAFFPFKSTDGSLEQSIEISGGELVFRVDDGTLSFETAPLTVPDAPCTLMVALERSTNSLVAAVCEVGGTAVASAIVDITGLGTLAHAGEVHVGDGDLAVQATISYWQALCDVGTCYGLPAVIASSLQNFTDYLVNTGGLRAAME